MEVRQMALCYKCMDVLNSLKSVTIMRVVVLLVSIP